MNSKFCAGLLTIAVLLYGATNFAAAETTRNMCNVQATQIAKGSSPISGNYIRCYQRRFQKCLEDNREVGTGGYQVYYMCRRTATKECRGYQRYRGSRQRYRG